MSVVDDMPIRHIPLCIVCNRYPLVYLEVFEAASAISTTVLVQSSGHLVQWLYNWARDRSATTLGLSGTHAINCHCTCTTIYTILYIEGRYELN
jgi:hypothetical protein